ncbi:class I SAM-dependent methyltransferase [Luedemannella helvata]|uniref:Class I SAM-dependent methyltransferase n=2 Tax=Luedemannella helvata TaxID=349315 RepID=A0ABP4X1I6_9ACTN
MTDADLESGDQGGQPPSYPEDAAHVARRMATAAETVRANHWWWDAAADAYQAEHGAFLGDVRFVWGPEGLDEADVTLLGDVAGRRVLEIGSGAGQCGRWLVARGARAVAVELSARQLWHSRRLDGRSGVRLPAVQADASRLPFAERSFDAVCSSYGALPFVADAGAVCAEVARVLRPGGRFVFSVTHPVRWSFPDDPGEEGLTAVQSYFDRLPYVEQDEEGVASYVEHHRTVGDWVRIVVGSGLRLLDIVEPEWPVGHDQAWGGWSPLRGRLLPGTAIFVCDLDPGNLR